MNAEILKVVINRSYPDYSDALKHMTDQGVNHLGWLNGGVKVPDHCTFEKVYSNRSGSSCLYVDPVYRVAYSVDMGD